MNVYKIASLVLAGIGPLHLGFAVTIIHPELDVEGSWSIAWLVASVGWVAASTIAFTRHAEVWDARQTVWYFLWIYGAALLVASVVHLKVTGRFSDCASEFATSNAKPSSALEPHRTVFGLAPPKAARASAPSTFGWVLLRQVHELLKSAFVFVARAWLGIPLTVFIIVAIFVCLFGRSE